MNFVLQSWIVNSVIVVFFFIVISNLSGPIETIVSVVMEVSISKVSSMSIKLLNCLPQ